MPEYIYHITTKSHWMKALENGNYRSDTLDTEGFTHCSTEEQVAGVLNRYYQGHTDLVKLKIERNRITVPVLFELAPSVNQEFPHIYGPLNLDAVVEIIEL